MCFFNAWIVFAVRLTLPRAVMKTSRSSSVSGRSSHLPTFGQWEKLLHAHAGRRGDFGIRHTVAKPKRYLPTWGAKCAVIRRSRGRGQRRTCFCQRGVEVGSYSIRHDVLVVKSRWRSFKRARGHGSAWRMIRRRSVRAGSPEASHAPRWSARCSMPYPLRSGRHKRVGDRFGWRFCYGPVLRRSRCRRRRPNEAGRNVIAH
jgi:hypothetical protein